MEDKLHYEEKKNAKLYMKKKIMASQEFHILSHYFNFIFHNSGIVVLPNFNSIRIMWQRPPGN